MGPRKQLCQCFPQKSDKGYYLPLVRHCIVSGIQTKTTAAAAAATETSHTAELGLETNWFKLFTLDASNHFELSICAVCSVHRQGLIFSLELSRSCWVWEKGHDCHYLDQCAWGSQAIIAALVLATLQGISNDLWELRSKCPSFHHLTLRRKH